jgi:2-polyprenyl-3-methyl-5-hydroxy-6-metoxy-1,4-benzoquinol methylase
MGNVDRAIEFYGRTAARYARRRAHGLREPVLARQRNAVIELADPRPTDSVLDIGCGAGRLAALLRPRVATICGVDASTAILALALPWLDEAVQGRLETLDLGRPFDLVICCGVLDFVDDEGAAWDAIRRHVAPQGRAVISAAAQSLVGIAYAFVRRMQGVRVRLYASDRLAASAANHGLRCTEVRNLRGGSVAVVVRHA